MSEKTPEENAVAPDAPPATQDAPRTGPETSQQRMIKYGANVVLAIRRLWSLDQR